MKEYNFYHKKIPRSKMLRIIIRSWFTSPPSEWGCLFLLLFAPYYLLSIFLQVILFLPVLPVIIFAYVPLSLKLYGRPPKTWLFWMGSYAICAIFLSLIGALLYYPLEDAPLFLMGSFIVLSGMCGMYAYFNVYCPDNVAVRIENNEN